MGHIVGSVPVSRAVACTTSASLPSFAAARIPTNFQAWIAGVLATIQLGFQILLKPLLSYAEIKQKRYFNSLAPRGLPR